MGEMSLGLRIKEVREKAGLNQDEFAKLLGLTPNTVSRYEQGHRLPDSNFLTHLVEKFKCDPGWLLTGKELKIIEQPSVNLDFMREVIESVEEVFQKDKLSLPPTKKAELIVLTYEELLEDESKRSSMKGKIIKLVRLAS